MEDIIGLTIDLGLKIQQQQDYLEMIAHQQKNDNDQELQQLIGEFNLKRIALNTEKSKSDIENEKDKIENLDQEVRDLYQKIMANPNMIEYSKRRQKVDIFMKKIYKILSSSAAGQDPKSVILENESESSCGSGCSSCSGCH